MKLAIEQLNHSLQKNIVPCYLLSCDESLLIQEAQTLITTRARELHYDIEPTQTIDAHFSWPQFLEQQRSQSLFSKHRLSTLRCIDGKINEDASQALQTYANLATSSSNCVVLLFPKLDSKTLQTTWFKAIDKIGSIITIWPPNQAQLPQWIQHRMQNMGMTIEPAAANSLADAVAGNLLAANQEIEKLFLLYGKTKINNDDILNSVADQAQFDVFNLVDFALQGHAQQIIRSLQHLRETGVEPAIILWALTREIRSLIQIRQQLDTGNHLEHALQQAKVWDKRKSILSTAVKRHQQAALLLLLQQAAQLDQMIKGLAPGNIWNHLQQLSLALGSINISLC